MEARRRRVKRQSARLATSPRTPPLRSGVGWAAESVRAAAHAAGGPGKAGAQLALQTNRQGGHCAPSGRQAGLTVGVRRHQGPVAPGAVARHRLAERPTLALRSRQGQARLVSQSSGVVDGPDCARKQQPMYQSTARRPCRDSRSSPHLEPHSVLDQQRDERHRALEQAAHQPGTGRRRGRAVGDLGRLCRAGAGLPRYAPRRGSTHQTIKKKKKNHHTT